MCSNDVSFLFFHEPHTNQTSNQQLTKDFGTKSSHVIVFGYEKPEVKSLHYFLLYSVWQRLSLLNKLFNDISDITVFFKRILKPFYIYFKRKITRKLLKYNLHVYRYACSHGITTLIYILSKIISIFQEVKLIYMKTSPYKHKLQVINVFQ